MTLTAKFGIEKWAELWVILGLERGIKGVPDLVNGVGRSLGYDIKLKLGKGLLYGNMGVVGSVEPAFNLACSQVLSGLER